MIRLLFRKSFYIILLLIIGIVIVLIKLNDNNDNTSDISIDFFVPGNNENLGCLALYINDKDSLNEYSFDDGRTWQNSKYGAIYKNGENYILIRNKNNKSIYSKKIEVNGIVTDAPVIKIDFDSNFSKNSLLKDVTATYNGKNILNKIKTNILNDNNDNLLISYLIENNGKKCYLIRSNNNTIEEVKEEKWLWPSVTPYKITRGVSDSHNGIDIYGPGRGTNVYAALDGQVIEINFNSSSGYYITIKHSNGYYTRYVHLQNTEGNDILNKTNSALKYVSVGQMVKQGDIIGEVGASGNSTDIHLHFEVWDGIPFHGKVLDPLSFYER